VPVGVHSLKCDRMPDDGSRSSSKVPLCKGPRGPLGVVKLGDRSGSSKAENSRFAQIPRLSEIERSADLTSFQRSVAEQSGRTVGVHRDREANNAQEISQSLPKTKASLDVLRITRSF